MTTPPITNTVEDKSVEYTAKKDSIVMEVMQDIFSRLPYDQKFQLSDGSMAYMKKHVAPKLAPSIEEAPQHGGHPYFAFDIIIEGGKLDHIEFYCYQTGWGGSI